jgi:diaminopimelate epimerase
VAHLVASRRLSPKREVRWQTNTGTITTRLQADGQVAVEMGIPAIEPSRIPCLPAAAVAARPIVSVAVAGSRTGAGAVPGASPAAPNPAAFDPPLVYTLATDDGGRFDVLPVSMGNPHGVIFVDDIATTAVAGIGAALTVHPFFPEGANIGFCELVDAGFVRLRVFERGVGETRACGTGACAAAVAGRLAGGLRDRVKVSLPGGKVRIDWQGPGAAVTMTGPATLVYDGRIEIT